MIQTAPQKQISPLNPLKVATWIGIISIIMLFAALSSAYIVRKADGNWLDFNLPNAFWITTGIICLSSFSMHWAVVSAKKESIFKSKCSTLDNYTFRHCLCSRTVFRLG